MGQCCARIYEYAWWGTVARCMALGCSCARVFVRSFVCVLVSVVPQVHVGGVKWVDGLCGCVDGTEFGSMWWGGSMDVVGWFHGCGGVVRWIDAGAIDAAVCNLTQTSVYTHIHVHVYAHAPCTGLHTSPWSCLYTRMALEHGCHGLQLDSHVC